ncbi:hypothetical protein [Streptomyces sp. R33]|uniref:Peptidylprolyl isomerase n=1 Tax=Streptomyces sp. R33 TaxID=3238629 RepID=A0AB39XV42_9ACTN
MDDVDGGVRVFGKITSGIDLLEQVADDGSDNANGEGDGAPK